MRPGALSLMTAGRGISHAETTTPTSPTLRGVQLWVALPDSARDTPPAFEHHPRLPVLVSGGVSATVVLGTLGETSSPATTYSPIVGADVTVSGSGGTLPLEPSWEHAVLALTDGLVVDGDPLPAGSLAYLGCDRDSIDLRGESRALLLGGLPFQEELLMWWNFVGRDDEVRTGGGVQRPAVACTDPASDPLAAPRPRLAAAGPQPFCARPVRRARVGRCRRTAPPQARRSAGRTARHR